MARPKIEINPIEVEKLAAMQCTNSEIAAFFDCSQDTIERRFAAELAKGREKGKAKLRRLQWQSAEKGNVVMQIWLGKQILGQSDKTESKIIDVGPEPKTEKELTELAKEKLKLLGASNEKDEPQRTA